MTVALATAICCETNPDNNFASFLLSKTQGELPQWQSSDLCSVKQVYLSHVPFFQNLQTVVFNLQTVVFRLNAFVTVQGTPPCHTSQQLYPHKGAWVREKSREIKRTVALVTPDQVEWLKAM